ncbi:MAG: hypothetical protein AAF960_27235 [Bacteroidota bacterium]
MHVTQSKYLLLTYDNSLDGLLSAIFDVYRLRLTDFSIKGVSPKDDFLFQPVLKISTNKAKANRIKLGLQKRSKQNLLPYLRTIFRQSDDKEAAIYQLVKRTFDLSTIGVGQRRTTNT